MYCLLFICYVKKAREYLCSENRERVKCFHGLGALRNGPMQEADQRHVLPAVERIPNKQHALAPQRLQHQSRIEAAFSGVRMGVHSIKINTVLKP